MNFSLTEDQLALQDAVRRYVDTSKDLSGLAELGVLGLTLPEQAGGSCLSAIERMLVASELGRGLMAAQWQLSSVQAATLIQNSKLNTQSSEALALLSQIAKGKSFATLGYANASAQLSADQFTGECRYVQAVQSCDWFFLYIAEPACWLMINAKAQGITRESFTLLDGSKGMHLAFSKTPIHAVLAQGTTAIALLELVRCHGDAALSAEALGAMQKLLELTTEHLKTRQQFGSTLAKFQALQHQLADQIVRYELFSSLVALAAMAVAEIDESTEPAHRYSSAAMAYLGQHSKPFCESIIQMHGAMGVTDESQVGKLVKRILLIAHWHGDAVSLRERFRSSISLCNKVADKQLSRTTV
jgi:alkylation response protein AidB-like acyl-CoA dehydrogenase